MKTFLQPFFALLLGASLAVAGNPIEFSADLKEFKGEGGITYNRLTFKDDKQTIDFIPPKGWNCTLSGKNLHLRPADKNFAAAEIEAIPLLAAPKPLDETAIAALAQQVLAALPPESQQATIVKQEQNPFLGNHEGFEVTASYKALGDTFQRSVLFVNTPTNQIVFKLTAKKSDFETLHRAFRGSISSWVWQESATKNPG